jgi:hypothetical protein
MMDLILFLLVSFSFCYLVVTSYIVAPVRNYFLVKYPYIGKLLSCIQCFGFWSGFLFSLLSYFGLISINQDNIRYSDIPIFSFLLCGLLASLFSVLANSLIFYLNSRDTYIIEKDKKKNQNE